MEAAGPAEVAIEKLASLELNNDAHYERSHLKEVVELISLGAPDMGITVDPIEDRSFKYHAGITFSFFSKEIQGELGSGGRYMTGNSKSGENATGLTLFIETLINAIPKRRNKKRIFIPVGTAVTIAEDLRAKGWVTINGLEKNLDPKTEAMKFQCGSYLTSKGIETV